MASNLEAVVHICAKQICWRTLDFVQEKVAEIQRKGVAPQREINTQEEWFEPVFRPTQTRRARNTLLGRSGSNEHATRALFFKSSPSQGGDVAPQLFPFEASQVDGFFGPQSTAALDEHGRRDCHWSPTEKSTCWNTGRCWGSRAGRCKGCKRAWNMGPTDLTRTMY